MHAGVFNPIGFLRADAEGDEAATKDTATCNEDQANDPGEDRILSLSNGHSLLLAVFALDRNRLLGPFFNLFRFLILDLILLLFLVR